MRAKGYMHGMDAWVGRGVRVWKGQGRARKVQGTKDMGAWKGVGRGRYGRDKGQGTKGTWDGYGRGVKEGKGGKEGTRDKGQGE